MVAAYREPDRTKGRELMHTLIESLREGVPSSLSEARRLGRTLTKRATDVLAYFDRALREAITRSGAMTPGLYVLFDDGIGHTIDNRAASDQ